MNKIRYNGSFYIEDSNWKNIKEVYNGSFWWFSPDIQNIINTIFFGTEF